MFNYSLTLILIDAAAIPKTRIVIQGWIQVYVSTKGQRKKRKRNRQKLRYNTQYTCTNYENSDSVVRYQLSKKTYFPPSKMLRLLYESNIRLASTSGGYEDIG